MTLSLLILSISYQSPFAPDTFFVVPDVTAADIPRLLTRRPRRPAIGRRRCVTF